MSFDIAKAERKGVEFSIDIEDDFEGPEGCFSSGDEELDKKIVADIRERMNRGDLWAWCTVKLTARYHGFEGHTYLGMCSYEDENDFRANSGYFEDMCADAYADLISNLETIIARTELARRSLEVLNRE